MISETEENLAELFEFSNHCKQMSRIGTDQCDQRDFREGLERWITWLCIPLNRARAQFQIVLLVEVVDVKIKFEHWIVIESNLSDSLRLIGLVLRNRSSREIALSSPCLNFKIGRDGGTFLAEINHARRS